MLQMNLKYRVGRYEYDAPCTLEVTEDRIVFIKSPFKFKDEIKKFRGYRWHGNDKPPLKPRKVWSIENHPRNVFQLKDMSGENVYANWDQPLIEINDWRSRGVLNVPAAPQQVDMVRRALTYHYQLWGAEMGLGKCLAAIETAERSGCKDWWYVGPLSALESWELEKIEWGIDKSINFREMTYDELVKVARYDFETLEAPQGIIFDELDLCKTATTHRTIAAQAIADLIREQHGFDGYVLGLTGTSMAKRPLDIWAQAEIIWPGFLKEGSAQAFERRYAVMEKHEDLDGVAFMRRSGWNEEECAQIHERLTGLMTVYLKEDWLNLPAKQYKQIDLKPDNRVLRVAKTLAHVAPNTITALNWTRALSSGFQYVSVKKGDKECPVCKGTGEYNNPTPAICPACAGAKLIAEYDRETVKVKTPKDQAVRDILEEYGFRNRIVFAASFQGSIDRVQGICQELGWATCVVDGRGWRVFDEDGKIVKGTTVMKFWKTHKGKVAFVGNPGSCRYGLTLTLAHVLCFYDNDFSASARLQMEDRIHRMSMDLELGAIIIDLVHLPVDLLVIENLRQSRKLELLSLGVITDSFGDEEFSSSEELLEIVA